MGRQSIKINAKRESILKAASELFAGRSYHEVMMDDVARTAGIAKGTLYIYFESKEELYYSVLCNYMDQLVTILNDGTSCDACPVTSLKNYIALFFEFLVKNKEFHLIFKKEALTNKNEKCSEVVKHSLALKNILMPILQRGEEEGLFEIADLGFTSEILIGSIYAAAWQSIPGAVRTKKDESYMLFTHLVKSISAKKVFPLLNKNIVLVSGEHSSEKNSEEFEREGANLLTIPAISIIEKNYSKLINLLNGKIGFDIIIFASGNAADIFFKYLDKAGLQPDDKIKIAVTGKRTGDAVMKWGYKPDFIPSSFSAEGLLDLLKTKNLEGNNLLIPRSSIGRTELVEELQHLGAKVFPVDIYDTVLPDSASIQQSRNKLKGFNEDIIVFTSPSAFHNFLKILNIKDTKDYFKNRKTAVIGKTTKAALENAGIIPDVVPDEYTIAGIINKLKDYYDGK
jgi:uroporphyrinogen-III synthase/AcrR family transcriptional regulator